MLDKICDEIKDLQVSKNADYGDACKDLYKEYGFNYYLIMLDQKLKRIKNIAGKEANNESLEDSLKDIAGYAIHAIKDLREEKEAEEFWADEHRKAKQKYRFEQI